MLTRYEAVRLQDMVNSVLAEAYEARDQINGPVNWADLKCVDIESRVSLLSDAPAAIFAMVEEASPSADEFCQWVASRLQERGYPDVSVESDW